MVVTLVITKGRGFRFSAEGRFPKNHWNVYNNIELPQGSTLGFYAISVMISDLTFESYQVICLFFLGPFCFLPNRPLAGLAFLLLVLFLTILTQFGGLLLWICLPIFSFFAQRTNIINSKLIIISVSSCFFLTLYLMTVVFLVPWLASLRGRSALPFASTSATPLKPTSLIYCLLSRNYVRTDLKNLAVELARFLARRYPGTVTVYLDANFPFFKNFHMVPHISH